MSKMSRWLQSPPKDSLEQQYQDLANQLRAKERALETTSHDLKVKTAAMQILEHKIMSSETQFTSAQRELTASGEQLKTLEAELTVRSKRLTDLEAEGVAARQRVSELNSTITALVNELRGAQQACQAAEQTHEVLKQEIRVLRGHIAQLNEGLADRDQLRTRWRNWFVKGRSHQLEVELSDREAAHRGVIQQFERCHCRARPPHRRVRDQRRPLRRTNSRAHNRPAGPRSNPRGLQAGNPDPAGTTSPDQ